MKKSLLTAVAGIALAAVAGMAQASQINGKLTFTPTGVENVYTVDVFAQVSGTTGTGGDGGLAGLEFTITSTNNNAFAKPGTGPNASKVVPVWDAALQGHFGFVNAVGVDNNADGKFDRAQGASFSDASDFGATTLGMSGFQHLASETWTVLNKNIDSPLTLEIVGPTSYNFGNTANNFHDDIGTTVTAGVTIPAVPEPASLSLLGLGALGLVARRRRA